MSGTPDRRAFDGVVCFGGEDWWYHNRGHYDMQMMRELARELAVLYVNSIGMRFPEPGEGRMFARRIARKLRSLLRGTRRVEAGFSVTSPPSVPGRRGRALTRRLVPRRVARAARALGVSRPLLWIACPPAAAFLEDLPHAALLYQRTDRFEVFRGRLDPEIAELDRILKRRADLTLFCSPSLFRSEAASCRRALHLDHGIDLARFEGAPPEPPDLAALPRPRVGFVGGIDAHTFDPELFVEVARLLPEATFVLVGACSLPAGWSALPNVHLLGQRPFEAVPGYMLACDVLIMPWNRSEWIQGCNPVKLKEYLAAGKPIVSTPFPALESYRDLVRVASTAETFAQAVRAALAAGEPAPDRARLAGESWADRAREVLAALAEDGIAPDLA